MTTKVLINKFETSLSNFQEALLNLEQLHKKAAQVETEHITPELVAVMEKVSEGLNDIHNKFVNLI